jgi:hypothetical protein
LVVPDAGAIINKSFEELEAFWVLIYEVSDFQQATILHV